MSGFTLVLLAYVAVVLAVGALATRRATSSSEEYFLAGRGLGAVVLFMALFGTNCTTFVLIGVPSRAYRDGLGVFGANVPIIALGIPLTFWAIGSPARRMARRLGAMTPAELYAKRTGSRAVGFVLFAVYTLYTLPYMVTAVEGAALTLLHVTDGEVPAVWGGAGVLLVALVYTSLGGMRATAWTNVLQGALFMGFMLVAFFLVPRALGGFSAATEAVREVRPELLAPGTGGLFEPRAFASWSLAISLTVIAFPHMLVRLFAARDDATLRTISRVYPIALVALWLPAVWLGVWGAALHPGLENPDTIFSAIAATELPPWLGSLGFLAVLAAVMSTLDAQLLTLGSMLTRDVLDPLLGRRAGWGSGPDAAGREVRIGRLFGVVVALAVFLLWRFAGETIFETASVAFSGYVTLAPTLLLGVRWRRFTAGGALLSILLGNAVYFACLSQNGGMAGALRPSWLGFLPVFWGLAAASLGAVLGSLLTERDEGAESAAFGS